MLKPRPAPETKQRQPAHVGLLRAIPTYRPVTSHEIPARRAAIRVVPGLPRRTTDDDTTTTTRDSKTPSCAIARPVPRARRVREGHGGAVVLVAGRVALASCVTPRGAGANLNASDAAA